MVSGPPDDTDQIRQALDVLDAGARSGLLVRCYATFNDDREIGAPDILTPRDAQQYLEGGRSLDLVIQYQSRAP